MIVDSLSSNCSELTLHVYNVWIVDGLSSNCSKFKLYLCNIWVVDTVQNSHYMHVMSGQLIVLVLLL